MKNSLLLCALATFLLAAGCAHKNTGDVTEGDDTLTPGGDIGWENGDTPMGGINFQTLDRITDAIYTPVYFGYNNYQLDGSEYAKMDAAADYLRGNDQAVLVVEGHCDERGTDEYNMSLGEYRAQAIRSYLVSAGISADRIQTQSYGKNRPAVPGSGESVWRLNRRGEFAFYRR